MRRPSFAQAIVLLPIVIVLVGIAASVLLVRELTHRVERAPTDRGELHETSAMLRARAHLSSRLGVSATEIVVVSIATVDWPDTSLGCPEPDRAYAQVITPGYRLLLSFRGEVYEYHAATKEDREIVSCPDNPLRHPGYPREALPLR
jgi:hypothetical protein